MSWLLVQCSEHWKGNRFTGPISFSVRLTKKDIIAYGELVETIYERTEVSRDKAELKLTSHVKMEDDIVTLSIMSDDDVEFVIIHKETGWAAIDVEFVNKHEFQPPANPIQSTCTVSPVKPTDNLRSMSGTPNYKSVSGSNNPLGSQASPGFTSADNNQATPAFTTKHIVVDDNDSSESIDTSGRSDSSKTSDTEDEIGDDDGGQPAIEDGTEERGVSRTPNSSSPTMNTRWTVSRSELYSIKVVRSVDMFEKSSDQGPIYKGQMFKDKPTLKRAVWSYAFAERNDNYNIEFKCVSACVIGDLFASKFGNPGLCIRPKDIVSEMKEQHGIHLSYNKAYRSKEHALNQVFGDR
ncbi:hypothetical protein Dsin_016063 [Dipteronia sinensis]|uniref:Uncharacterized protein n=1 Tax=Dipteronia sinensis TaxID=43782 RepID=A0AAE0E5D0_9ROSI|nr:hypothetical protein Dsin_016063 [Dipteronia sinensis]